jgi:OOP family OmpA-OmpF porin
MSIKTLAWIALIAWICGSTYWHVCKIKQLCDGPSASSVGYAVPALKIIDGTNLNLESSSNFGFKKSLPDVNYANVQRELDSLANYIKMNPNRKTTITGLYSSVETNATTFVDLGLARADGIKQYLVGKGIPSNQLETASRMTDLAFSPEDSLHGMEFGFGDLAALPTTEAGLADAEKYEGVFSPIDFYFGTAKADYIKTTENKKFLDEAKKYLAANKDKKLVLIGHTDSEGEDASNQRLSEKRAADVKTRLVKTGIAAEQIVTEAKGETEPKASNDTAEGRRANRRVSIVVQ